MKFFDPRMRIIMESVQPINREYVRVTGKLVTLTRSSKFRSSKLLKAAGNVSLACTNNLDIQYYLYEYDTDSGIHITYGTTIFHDSFSFGKYFYVCMNFNFKIRISS